MMAIAYLLQVVESSAFAKGKYSTKKSAKGHADVELLLEMLFLTEGSRKENP